MGQRKRNTIVKTLMMKKLQILQLPLLAFSLIACSTEEEKNILQATFDKYNPNGNAAICVASGINPQVMINLTQPYTTYDIELGVDDYSYLTLVNDTRKERLATFAEVGLLNQKVLPNGQFIYTLTELGLSYISKRGDRFCFGRVVITDIKYEKKQDGMKLYTYSSDLENVPDWAKDPHLDKIDIRVRMLSDPVVTNSGGGGMVFFTSDKQIAGGQDVGRRIF